MSSTVARTYLRIDSFPYPACATASYENSCVAYGLGHSKNHHVYHNRVRRSRTVTRSRSCDRPEDRMHRSAPYDQGGLMNSYLSELVYWVPAWIIQFMVRPASLKVERKGQIVTATVGNR